MNDMFLLGRGAEQSKSRLFTALMLGSLVAACGGEEGTKTPAAAGGGPGTAGGAATVGGSPTGGITARSGGTGSSTGGTTTGAGGASGGSIETNTGGSRTGAGGTTGGSAQTGTGGVAVDTTGGRSTGGSGPTGGSSDARGGASMGGSNAVGGTQSSGGNASGGLSPSGGAARAGGSAAGGGPSGGTASGGTQTGGRATGGSGAGGSSSGGAQAGGSSTGGAGTGGSSGGAPGLVCTATPLDCGAVGIAMVNAGPPSNRVNFVIVGDGYAQADIETTYMTHINDMLDVRWGVSGDPYARYRNFVNICALKAVSQTSGIGTSAGNTVFKGYGNDNTRLGYMNNSLVNSFISSNVPASLTVDWRAVVFNDSSWWNSGANPMIWSGGHAEAGGAALHEGGHGYHALADEYGGSNTGSSCTTEPREINMTADRTNTAGKWSLWLGYDQAGLTGLQSTFDGGNYCEPGLGMWRPSDNSIMNMLFSYEAPTNVYNSISREKIIRDIYKLVSPIDCSTSNATTLNNPSELEVVVVDPLVIKVDWSVDGTVAATDGNGVFTLAGRGLATGSHTVTARAHDDTDLVRGDRAALERTVTWSITIP